MPSINIITSSPRIVEFSVLLKAQSDKTQTSADSAVDCVNSEIGFFIFSATMHCIKPRSLHLV